MWEVNVFLMEAGLSAAITLILSVEQLDLFSLQMFATWMLLAVVKMELKSRRGASDAPKIQFC